MCKVWPTGAAGDISHFPAGCAAVLLLGSGHQMDGEAPAPHTVLHASASWLHPGVAIASSIYANALWQRPESSLSCISATVFQYCKQDFDQ